MKLSEHHRRLLDDAESWVSRLLEANGGTDVFSLAESRTGETNVIQPHDDLNDWELAVKRTVAEVTGMALRGEITGNVLCTQIVEGANRMVIFDVESNRDGRVLVIVPLKKKMFGGWAFGEREFKLQEPALFKSRASSPMPAKALPMATRDDLHLIYPYVVPKSWVSHVGADALVSWQFTEDVHVVLVIDRFGNVQNVRPEDLQQVHESVESAFEIAAQNLSRALKDGEFEIGGATLRDGIEIAYSRGNWMAPAGGLMLSALYQGMQKQFGGDEFAAIAVNQQCLFAFPLDERTLKSESLRLAVDDELRAEKPISPDWLFLDGRWPRPYPYSQTFGPDKGRMQ